MGRFCPTNPPTLSSSFFCVLAGVIWPVSLCRTQNCFSNTQPVITSMSCSRGLFGQAHCFHTNRQNRNSCTSAKITPTAIPLSWVKDVFLLCHCSGLLHNGNRAAWIYSPIRCSIQNPGPEEVNGKSLPIQPGHLSLSLNLQSQRNPEKLLELLILPRHA